MQTKIRKAMKILLIILAVVVAIAATTALVLSHPAFGRKMSNSRKARIESAAWIFEIFDL